MTAEVTRQIIAMGGGGFTMEGTPLLDNYVLKATGKKTPKICFLPTASGDSVDYVARFQRSFARKNCIPTVLELFRRDGRHLEGHLLDQDAIYVGGGNTANMLAVWRVHGVDVILREAWNQGIVLSGVSAGAGCWFEGSSTDSFGPALEPLRDGLALLQGSLCPHYDGEERRRPRFHEMLTGGTLPAGFGVDDSAALHFHGDTLHRVVSSSPHARAYSVRAQDKTIQEALLPCEYLGTTAGVQDV